jgi:MFS family permease
VTLADRTTEPGAGGAQVDPRVQRNVLLVAVLGMFTTSIPYTLLGASLDTLGAELGAPLSTISWVQVAPTLAAGVSVPIFGKLCDLWGPRRIFLLGMGATAVGSLLAACAWSAGSLIAIRTVGQLLGGASSPAGFAVVAHAFSGRGRARAIGQIGAVGAIAPVIGVLAGGPLVDWLGWQLLFLIQAVPAVVGFALALRLLPDTGVRRRTSFDLVGAGLLACTVIVALFGLNRLRPWGIDHVVVLACVTLAPVLAAALVAVERRRPAALLPIGLVAQRDLGLMFASLGLLQTTFLGASIAIPLLLHRRYGFDLAVIAYLVAVRPVGFAAGSWAAAACRRRFSNLQTQQLAAVIVAVAFVGLAVCSGPRLLAVLLVCHVVGGIGSGLGFTAAMAAVNDLAPPADVGIANGIASMAGTIGGAVGVTVVSALVADADAAATFRGCFLVMAACCVPIVAVAHRVRPRRAPVTRGARDAAARLT